VEVCGAGEAMSKEFELIQQADLGLAALEAKDVEAERDTNNKSAYATDAMAQVDRSVREELMKLVQRLFLTPGHELPKTLMFAGIDGATGCSQLCAVTADLLAQSVSGSVCIMEADCRSQRLGELFGVENHFGFADSLRQEGPIRAFAKQLLRVNLWLLSSGSLGSDCRNFLISDRMTERIAELRAAFDYVLIDAPPLNTNAEAMVLGRNTDGVVLVLEANTTRREAALRAAQNLRAAGITVLGAVLNKRTFPIPAVLYKRL
jgi:protein-tyrosine kinase